MQLLKKALRKQLIARRKELDALEKVKMDEAIFLKLMNSECFKSAKLVLLYVSTEIEVDTQRLIDYCLETGKRIASPVSLDSTLLFREVTSRIDFRLGRYNISEPSADCTEIVDFNDSICIVPALSVNEDGYRIGYGKGYYDRFLRGYDGISVCLCYKSFIGEIPTDKFDIKPDIIITD